MNFEKVRDIIVRQLDLDPASVTMDSRLIEEIISTCDGHLYAAKRNGRNCVA